MTAPTVPPAAAGEDPVPPLAGPSTRARLRSATAGLLSRVRLPRAARRPHWLLGALAGLWAAAIGAALALLPMVVTWMASPDTGLTWVEALRLGGLVWVVAHGVPVILSGVTLTLLPWGLVIVPLLLLGYGGGWAARRSGAGDPRALAALVGAGTLVYAVAVAVVSSATAEPASRTAWWTAALHAGVIAVLGLGWGAVRAAGLRPLDALPRAVAIAARAGAVSAAALLGLGALAATASLLAHLDLAITMAQSLEAGLGGGLALAVLGMAYVPVLVVWAAAYTMGAGVVLAPSVTLTPFLGAAAPADLPPFPLLAALPQGATPLAWLLPVTGVLAGVLGGLLIARRARREPRLVRLAMAGGAAAVGGTLLALAAWLASGGLGDGRLALLGPTPLTVGVLAAVLIVLGAVPSAVAPAGPARPTLAVANRDEPESHEPDE